MGIIIFLVSYLSFRPSYSIANVDLLQYPFYSTPKLSTLPITYLYNATDKGFNEVPKLGLKIYSLEGLGATLGAIVLGTGTLLAGGFFLVMPLLAPNSDNGQSGYPMFVILALGAAALSGIPLGAVYGIKKVGQHYKQKGSTWGAFWGALIGMGLTCGLYGLAVYCSPLPEESGRPRVSAASIAFMCLCPFAFPASTVMGYNYKHIFHKE